jgi:hypothetical protein
LFEEVEFLPQTKYFPGVIGGHCVIPNIELLLNVRDSALCKAVLRSNELRKLECSVDEAKIGQTC